ncbi:MAG: hypothetical protein IJ418_16240 [Clostridia bacterium]|nr:hypothetical protein [Clostridia bacterium]
MAFWGTEFVFDGIPCSEYGLMVYHFGSEGQEDVDFQSGEIIEDRISSRYDALTYGLVQNTSLEYTLVFGANMESIDANASLDRYDVEAIASWLTGHQTLKWLMICQNDMEPFRYKCAISELRLITYGDMPWAFSCKVSCDSPFAYRMPTEYSFSVNGELQARLFNRSSYNGFYRPNMEISLHGSNSISIQNISDGGRIFKFSALPNGNSLKIYIDNKNQVITNNMDLNLYPYFNMKFMRLIRGDNVLKITGKAEVKFICEFPVNIGG